MFEKTKVLVGWNWQRVKEVKKKTKDKKFSQLNDRTSL